MISLSSYADTPNGFGVDSSSNLGELEKALTAGYQVSSQTNGGALRVESLEGSLKVVTYNAHHIKFWKKIPKSPAYSTVEEYNQLTSYGSSASAFVGESELPAVQDSTYARRTALVKFIGTTREVSHAMTVVHPAHGDVIALENQNGILWLLEKIENSLFHGDSTLALSGQSESWDGLDAMIDSTSFIDLEGQPLQEADIEEGTNQLVEQFAYPTDLWLGTRVASDLVKTFYPRERIQLPAPANGMVGMAVSSVMTQAGPMELNPNVFLRRAPVPPTTATSANAPATPTGIVTTFGAGAATGDFQKGAPTGTNYYNYVVTACNRFGESAPTAYQVANVNVTWANAALGYRASNVVTNAAAIGNFPPEYFRIYRTAAMTADVVPTSLSSYSLIQQVPVTTQSAGAANTAVLDNNLMLPFTETAYMGEMTPSVLTMRQLLPLMKMDLAVNSPAYRWMILMYAVPLLFASKKWLKFINIGRLQ